MQTRPRRKAEAPRPESCLNCGFGLAPEHNYCANCGQDAATSRVAVGDLLREAWAEFMQVDSKLVRTLSRLLFRPGFLTREYLAGKRIRYISPFKMYLVVAALFFALAAWVGANTVDKAKLPLDSSTSSKGHGAHHPDGDHINVKMGNGDINLTQLPESIAVYERSQKALPPEKRDDTTRRFVLERAIRIRSLWRDDKQQLVSSIIGYFPTTMFFLLPLYALLLRLLYVRSPLLFVEHLIFALHIHTMFFIVCGIGMLLTLPPVALFLSQYHLDTPLLAGIWLYFLFYSIVAARRVYEQGIAKTLFKGWLLITTYLTIVTLALAGTILYALARV